MKKIFILLAGATFILASCGSKGGGTSDKAKKNMEACNTVVSAFQSGDTSKIDDIVADDFVNHTEMGESNKDTLKSMIVMNHQMFPDMKWKLVKQVGDDDYVMNWYTVSGTGDGMMMPAGPFEMNSVEVVRFNADGKAVEHWSFVPMLEAMKMADWMKSHMPATGGDTTHMPMPPAKDTAK